MLRNRMAKAAATVAMGAAVLIAPAAAQAAATEPPQVAEAPATPVVDAEKTDMGWQ